VKVVLLHALPLDGASWSDVAELLDEEVVAPTLYGLGDSLRAWADAVLDLAGPGPYVLVGNSVGGSCALEVALLAPRQVHSLVLVGAKAGHRPEPELCERAVEILQEQGVAAAWSSLWEPLIAPQGERHVRDRLRRAAFAQSVPDLINGVRVFHSRPDRSALLATWTGPVTVVSGQYDISPERAASGASGLRAGRFVLLPGSGHYAPVEAPDALARVIREALADRT
jgi:pimeloyl-ACP methyl ester carboxylesterase